MSTKEFYSAFNRFLLFFLNRKSMGTLLLCLGLLGIAVWEWTDSTKWVWHSLRLLFPQSLKHGLNMYYLETTGPAFNQIYPPLAALAYLPTLIAKSPLQALYIGFALSCLYFFLPVWLFIKSACPKWPRAAFFTFFLSVLACEPLRRVAFGLHADVPGIGLYCIGLWQILYGKHTQRHWISSAMVILAIWCKQIFLFGWIAIAVWVAVKKQRAEFKQFLIASLTFAAITFGIFSLLYGPGELLLNLYTLPSKQAWWANTLGEQQKVLFELFQYSLPWMVLLYMYNQFQTKKARSKFLVWVAICLLPIALMGRMKMGGGINAFSFCLFPLLLAFSTSILPNKFTKALWCILFVVYVVQTTQERFPFSKECYDQQAYKFSRESPGVVYFPYNPLGVLMAEGKLYHTEYGLFDREIADHPLSLKHFQKHAPKYAKLACWPPNRANKTLNRLLDNGRKAPYLAKYLPLASHRTIVEQLPEWECFKITNPIYRTLQENSVTASL